MNKYLILFHLTEIEQTEYEWGKYAELLNSQSQLLDGSALAKPIGLQKGKLVDASSKTIGGYMVISANSHDDAVELAKNSPSHVKNGHVEIFHII